MPGIINRRGILEYNSLNLIIVYFIVYFIVYLAGEYVNKTSTTRHGTSYITTLLFFS